MMLVLCLVKSYPIQYGTAYLLVWEQNNTLITQLSLFYERGTTLQLTEFDCKSCLS